MPSRPSLPNSGTRSRGKVASSKWRAMRGRAWAARKSATVDWMSSSSGWRRAGMSSRVSGSVRGPGMGSVWHRSAFDGSGQAANDAAFGDGQEAERREHRERGERQDARGVLRVLGLEGRHAERQGEVVLLVEDEQRQQVRVPAGDEGENGHGGERGAGEREQDPPE